MHVATIKINKHSFGPEEFVPLNVTKACEEAVKAPLILNLIINGNKWPASHYCLMSLRETGLGNRSVGEWLNHEVGLRILNRIKLCFRRYQY